MMTRTSFPGEGTLLVDVPGISTHSTDEIERLVEALDAIGVRDRVMVMNAAYELSVLEKHARVADQLGAQYAAYTYLDELDDVSKLWSCILAPGRSTLFFSRGPNAVGDLIHDSFGYLIKGPFREPLLSCRRYFRILPRFRHLLYLGANIHSVLWHAMVGCIAGACLFRYFFGRVALLYMQTRLRKMEERRDEERQRERQRENERMQV